MEHSSKIGIVGLFLHLAAWLLVFISPLLFAREMLNDGFELNYLAIFLFPFVLMVMFYTNYALLIPKLLFKAKHSLFFLSNLFLIVALSFSIFYVHDRTFPPFRRQQNVEMRMIDGPQYREGESMTNENREGAIKKRSELKHRDGHPKHREKFRIRILNDVLILLFVGVVSVLLRYTMRWFSALSKMKDLEKEKAEVELKNLKSQLNPHFLFNTLNNIYALIGVNQEKAQQAVMDLSKLLRYALYEGNQCYVTLEREVEFVDNYIKLMRLRLSNSVSVTTAFNVGGHGNLLIAQMLFITLVENAFKHGVSLTQPSFISIQLEVTGENEVTFSIENSSFPKGKQDKSGSGIGIENLKRRLELIYPGNYTYVVSADSQIYRATLSIKITDSL